MAARLKDRFTVLQGRREGVPRGIDFHTAKRGIHKLRRDKRAAATAKLIASGGMWSDATAGQRNQSSTLCGQCGQAVGTWRHLCFRCDSLEAVRRQALHPQVAAAEAKAPCGATVFEKGLMQNPEPYLCPPATLEEWRWHTYPSEGYFQGDVFVDGAGRFGDQGPAARSGLGAAQIDEAGNLTASGHGPTAGPYQEVAHGELASVVATVSRAIPPLTIYSDCQYVVSGFRKGRRHCLKAKGRFTRTWKRLFQGR